ncbi:MAG: ATP-dependent Clp protease adapter ClpS [Halobacteria archaeon]
MSETQTIEKTVTHTRPAPNYKVLIHNDPYNHVEYVTQVLMQVVGIGRMKAEKAMLEAHNTGVGLVITCPEEHAEAYSQQINEKGITSTIEPEE